MTALTIITRKKTRRENGDSRRASVNASLGLPDDQDAEFLDASDYERDSLSGDSTKTANCTGLCTPKCRPSRPPPGRTIRTCRTGSSCRRR